MSILAGIAFFVGLGAAFRLNLFAFGLLTLATVVLVGLLAASGLAFGFGIGWAMLTAGVTMQSGYLAGIALRTVIIPFFERRANERASSGIALPRP